MTRSRRAPRRLLRLRRGDALRHPAQLRGDHAAVGAHSARPWSLSGVAEILGGAALLARPTRRFARWWLLGLLVAVFPANVHMAVNPEQVDGLDLDRLPRWALWARLPLQPLAMLWVWRATRD